MVDNFEPTIQNPEYILVIGSTVNRMRERILFLFKLIEEGKVKPNKIFILTGERKLDKKVEAKEVLLDKNYIRDDWECPSNLPNTEVEAVAFIWNQLPKPKQVEDSMMKIISVPMFKDRRPNIMDTTMQWLKTNDVSESILVISTNPFIPYQHETVKMGLLKKYGLKRKVLVETVGIDLTQNLEIMLDTVARYIYVLLEAEMLKSDLMHDVMVNVFETENNKFGYEHQA